MHSYIYKCYLVVLLGLPQFSKGQYVHSIGLKANDNFGGLHYKGLIYDESAIDFTFSWLATGGTGLSFLFEKQYRLMKVQKIYGYYGGGMHIGAWTSRGERVLSYGMDGVVGIEHVATKIPFVFSLDYIPGYIFEGNRSRFDFTNWAASVRYTFSK